jgi:hypothetical protein
VNKKAGGHAPFAGQESDIGLLIVGGLMKRNRHPPLSSHALQMIPRTRFGHEATFDEIRKPQAYCVRAKCWRLLMPMARRMCEFEGIVRPKSLFD